MAEGQNRKSIYDKINKPLTTLPSQGAGILSRQISRPNDANPTKLKGFMSGTLESIGSMGDDMTSPLSLAMMAGGGSILSPFMKSSKEISSLGRVAESMGISPSMLPKDLIPSDSQAQSIYNASKRILPQMRNASEVAYDNIMRKGGMGRRRDDIIGMMDNVRLAKGLVR